MLTNDFQILSSLYLYNLLAKLKNKDHVSCLSSLAFSVLSKFFQIPGPYIEWKLYTTRILLSLDASYFQILESVSRGGGSSKFLQVAGY